MMVLSFTQYDAKLLRPINATAKELNHTLLEHFIEIERQRVGNWKARYATAQIYEGVTAADLSAFRSLGLELVLANGKWAYFTDAQTAALVQHHVARSSDAIAYGSLFISNANASTVQPQARILVLDDTATVQDAIAQLPQIRQALGNPIGETEFVQIHQKLGDCYNLVSSDLAHAVAYSLKQKQPKDPERSPFQFRAGSPDMPGVIKGTCRVSAWCDRLQVDAILSLSSFKATQQLNGEKPQLVGIQTVSNFFFANKSYAATTQQKRGLQPALVTPEATQQEVLPQLVEKAIAVAQIQANSQSATAYYLSVAERRQQQQIELDESDSEEADDSETFEASYVDTIAEILKADSFQQMQGHPKVIDAIAKVLHHEWMDAVTVGVYSPSATAQPHADLKPWECCFRELPHGALVALYRAPLGNVAAIGTFINNIEQLRESDLEAFRQQGVVYLNPWSAANILITDFDGDRNAIIPGYVAVSPGTTVYSLQEQLQDVLDPGTAYEAAQSLFHTAIQDSAIFIPTESPIFVAEVLDKNRPEVRPTAVNKEPKIERQGTIEECAIHAANNPTGVVANLGMKIDSLYWDIAYLAPEQRSAYLQQVCSHYAKILEWTEIPQPESYIAVLARDLQFSDRVRQIVTEGRQILQLPEQMRVQAAEPILQKVQTLLWDVKAIIAMNLQRAVDSPKSAREVEWELQKFAAALGKYKENTLLNHRKDADLYQPLKARETPESARILSTSTVDPVARVAEQVNQHYREVVLIPRSRDSFLPLFPNQEQGGFDQTQAFIARSWVEAYNTAIQRAAIAQELAKSEVGPSLIIQAISGRQLRLVNLTQCDPQGISPIWQAARQDATLAFQVRLNQDWQTKAQFSYAVSLLNSSQIVGFVSPESIRSSQTWLRQVHSGRIITIPTERIERCAFEPRMNITQAKAEITEAVQRIMKQAEALDSSDRLAMAAALWHQGGQHLVIQAFHPELCQQLQALHHRTMTVVGLQHPTNQHQERSFSNEPLAIAVVVETNSESAIAGRTVLQIEGKTLGPFSTDSYQLPVGTHGEARILFEAPAVAKVTLPDQSTIKISQVQSHHFVNQTWNNEAVELGMKRRDSLRQAPSERKGSQWAELVLTMRDSNGQMQDLGVVSTAKDRQAVEAAFRYAAPVLKRETTISASLTSDIARTATVHIMPENLRFPQSESQTDAQFAMSAGSTQASPESLYAQIFKTEYVWSAEALSRYLKPGRSYDYIQYERIEQPNALVKQRLPMYFDGAMMTRITGVANSIAPNSAFDNTFDAIAADLRTSTLRNHGQIKANVGDIVAITGQPGQSLLARITALQTFTVPPSGVDFQAAAHLTIPQSAQPRPNPLADLPAVTVATARHMQKDIAMAEIATQFIGKSAAPDYTPSSTRNYELAWGDRANTGSYTPTDVVMVSGSGPWRGVSQAAIQQTFETHYQPLLDRAIAAQAQFVVGNAAGTDQLVQQYLQSCGYTLEWNSISPSNRYLKASSPLIETATVAESGQDTSNSTKDITGHCPSRRELLQWYQAYQIRAQTHPNDSQKLQQDREGMAHVEAIRLRQKTEGLQPITVSQTAPVYRDAEGNIVNISHDEFRNPKVTLSPKDHQRMQRAIQYFQQRNLSTYTQTAARSQALNQH